MIRRHQLLAMLMALSTVPAAAQVQQPNATTAPPPTLAPNYARPAGFLAPPGYPVAAAKGGTAERFPQYGTAYTAESVGERYAAPTTPSAPSAAPAGASSWPAAMVRQAPSSSRYAPPRQTAPATTFDAPLQQRPVVSSLAPSSSEPVVVSDDYRPFPQPRSSVVQAAGTSRSAYDSRVSKADFQQQPTLQQPQPPVVLPAPVAPQSQLKSEPQVPAPPSDVESDPSQFPTGSFRLDELVGMAITHNPILRRAMAEIEEAKGERVQAGLYPNPAMETNNPEVFAGQTSFVNFGFQQFIVVKGKLRLEKAAADQLVRASTAEYRLERSRMLTDVRKQYYEVLAAKHRVYLARHLTALAERGVNGSRQLEKAGEGTRTDVLLLDTEYQRELIRLQNAETTYQGELKQLSAVVGLPEVEIRDVEGTLFETPPVFNEQDVQAFLNHTSTYIEKARAEITRSQMQLRRAEVEPYPNLRMGPAFQTGTLPRSAQFWLTVEFEIPVWDLNQGNIRKANATVQERLADLEILRNELNRKTAELFARHQASRERAERIRTQILPNAQQALNLIQDAYVKGQFDVNRLLESQRNLAEVSSDYFEAAEESWITASELAGMLQIEQFPQ